MKLEEAIRILDLHDAELRSRGVRELSIFGSVARGEAREDSNVDTLVEFDRRVGLLAYAGLNLYLEEIFGRKVDLVTAAGLRPSMREAVLREAIRAA